MFAVARALASPVRRCVITGAALPSDFLLAFKTVFRHGKHATTTPSDSGLAKYSDESDLPHNLVPHLLLDAPWLSKVGSLSYTFNSHALVTRMGSKRMGGKRLWQRLISQDVASRYGIRNRGDWVWDEDMPNVVLAELRERVVSALAWGFKHPAARLVRKIHEDGSVETYGKKDKSPVAEEGTQRLKLRCGADEANQTLEDAQASDDNQHKDLACLLLLRPLSHSSTSPDLSYQLPVFDLHKLLTPSEVSTLTSHSFFAAASTVALPRGWKSTKMQLPILRLATYLSTAAQSSAPPISERLRKARSDERLIESDDRDSNPASANKDGRGGMSQAALRRERRSETCFSCGGMGHQAKDCPQLAATPADWKLNTRPPPKVPMSLTLPRSCRPH